MLNLGKTVFKKFVFLKLIYAFLLSNARAKMKLIFWSHGTFCWRQFRIISPCAGKQFRRNIVGLKLRVSASQWLSFHSLLNMLMKKMMFPRNFGLNRNENDFLSKVLRWEKRYLTLIFLNRVFQIFLRCFEHYLQFKCVLDMLWIQRFEL